MGLFALLAAQAPVYVPSAVPPPLPPIVRTAAAAQVASDGAERYVVDVEARAGGEVLWSGPMIVATTAPTSFLRRLSEPASAVCPSIGYGSQAESSLSIQLTPQRQSGTGTALGVMVHWGRSIPNGCPFRGSSRTVELTETVALSPGQAAVLSGDGGLTLRLRRR